jgi:hypothetical protein
MRATRTSAVFFSLAIFAGFGIAPVSALDWGWNWGNKSQTAGPAVSGDPDCAQPKACIVEGAEVDDAATIAARKTTGTGPARGIASDMRLKSDIKHVGTLDNGIKIYSFKFLWDDKVRVGVIAQDLLARADTKGAVLTLANGLLGVDYKALGLRMSTEQQWIEAGPLALQADYRPKAVRSAKADEPITLYNRRPGR